MGTETIYVPLADEGVDVWAPVEAEAVGDNAFRLPDESPADETWQFPPGTTVVCERRWTDGKQAAWAVRER
jgi:hypothetical protein